jgi:alanyl-tRNA synthetase
VADAAADLVAHTREQEERIAAFEARARSNVAADLAERAEQIGDGALVVAEQAGLSPDELRTLALQVRDRIGTGVVVLGSQRDGKAGLVAVLSKDLVASGRSAADIAGAAARKVGGGSSRDPEMSQAGGPRGDDLPAALDEARTLGRAALEGE